MADLLPNDQFLVNRSNTTSTVTSENLMATILDDDLMLVNRGNQTYKVTGADVKDSLGSKPIYPEPDEITGNPGFESGSGTEVDPFILKTIDVRPGGSSGFSVEEITIDVPGTTEGQPVVWTDNSVDAGARFTQPSGVTSVGGSWTGRLVYTDAPATLVDTEYVGKLQIGDAYFQWTVTQGIDPVRPIDPTPDEVTANPPFLSGIGTQVDPFILNPSVAAPSGSAIESVQEITIAEAGAAPGELVRWIDNSVDAGVRFTQPEELTNGDGKWVGRLDYFDDPATETDEIYTGDLQIGEVYFRWQVTQLPTADIRPEPGDITANPDFQSGSGTVGDPYVLQSIEVRPAGSTGTSVETLTITAPSGVENLPVVWTVNAGGDRFEQQVGITGPGGVWTGQLSYIDTPDTSSDQPYTGLLQIGTVYFSWTVDQFVLATVAPEIAAVSLVESNPTADPRFTDQEFVASVSMTEEGTPVSEKTIDAYVEGSITTKPVTDEIEEIEILPVGVNYTSGLTVSSGIIENANYAFNGNLNNYARSELQFAEFEIVFPSAINGKLDIYVEANAKIQFKWWSSSGAQPSTGFVDLGADGKYTFASVTDCVRLEVGNNQDSVNSTDYLHAWLYGIAVDDVLLVDSPVAALTFKTNQDLANFDNGDSVSTTTTKTFDQPLESNLTLPGGWIAASAAEANSWKVVTYGGGKFVAVANSGTNRVMYSTDGISWTAASAAEDSGWQSVTYGNGKFVAVARTGTNRVMYSADGISWTAASATEDNSWTSVTYGNGKFVAVSATGTNRVMYSADGINWNATSAAEANDWFQVIYGNGKFVAVASNISRVMYSPDGINWNAAPAPGGDGWYSVTYGNDKFVAVRSNGADRVMYSSDGINWTDATAAEVNSWWSVTYGDNKFVAVAQSGTNRVMSSADGISWTAISATEDNSWTSVTYGGDKFVAVTSSGTNRVMYSYSGDNSPTTSLEFAAGTPMEPLAAGDSVFQTNNFTEPLESSNTLPAPTATYTNCEANSEPVGRFFDGSSSTSWRVNSIRNPSATFPWTCQTDFPPQSFTRLAIYSSNVLYRGTLEHTFIYEDGTTKVESFTWETGARWQEFSDLDTSKRIRGIRTKVVNNVADFKFTGISFDWDGVSGPLAVVGASTSLTFAAGTDMAALAPGDEVSQVGDIPPGSLKPSELLMSEQVWWPKPPVLSFDGDLNTFSETPSAGDKVNWVGADYIPDNATVEVYCKGTLNSSVTLLNTSTRATIETGSATANSWFSFTPVSGQPLEIQIQGGGSEPTKVAAFRVNGKIVLDPPSGTVGSITDTTVTLSESIGTWEDGKDVTTGDKNSVGAISEINDTTLTLSSSSGVWVNGTNVYGNEKRGIGTVSSTDPAARTMTLITSNGGFCDYQVVEGPIKTLSSATRYLKFDDTGAVTDLLGLPQNPAYVTTDANPGLTLTFPSTFTGSGQAPDDELGEGTTLTVSATASNDAGTDGPETATVQPEGTDLIGPALNGLTTLYDGNNGTTKSIVNGINLVNNDGMVWIKSRDNGSHNNWLFSTLLGDTAPLSSNLRDNIDNCNANYFGASPLITFQNNGFNLASQAQINSNGLFVSWTFAKAEGYFDVVTTDSAPGTFSHSLGQKPGMIIVKATANGNDWYLYHSGIPNPDRSYAALNKSDVAQLDKDDLWNVTETTFDLPGYLFGGGPISCVAYLFAEDTPGVIKCGSYVGTSGSQQIDTGFAAQWVLIKNTTSNGSWAIVDNKRPGKVLLADTSAAESSTNIGFTSNGFSLSGGSQDINSSGDTFIYVAIAAPPAARSLTQQEFAATRLNFETYANRAAVHEGEEAMAARQALIVKLREQGYTDAEIDAELGI